MIGITRSVTQLRTASRTMRSSSVSSILDIEEVGRLVFHGGATYQKSANGDSDPDGVEP